MTMIELRAQCEHQPFLPFVMHLADGRQIQLAHPDFVAFAPNGRSAFVYQPNNSYNVVELRMVTDFEVTGNGAAPQANS